MGSTWLVVGLGNPGLTYAGHRHNVGFMVVDEIARRANVGFSAPKGLRVDLATTRLTTAGWGGIGAEAERVALMRSRSYMNETGGPASAVLKHLGGDAAHVVVVHDELDLDLGQLRLKRGGGDNGHNGLRSLRASLGTGDFLRVRVGIGRPPGRQEPADWVLSNFPAKDREEVALAVGEAADAVEELIRDGLEAAQNRHHR